jgi:hypothetical protein
VRGGQRVGEARWCSVRAHGGLLEERIGGLERIEAFTDELLVYRE